LIISGVFVDDGLDRWEAWSDGFLANDRGGNLLDTDEQVLNGCGFSGLIAERDVVGLHLENASPTGPVHLFLHADFAPTLGDGQDGVVTEMDEGGVGHGGCVEASQLEHNGLTTAC